MKEIQNFHLKLNYGLFKKKKEILPFLLLILNIFASIFTILPIFISTTDNYALNKLDESIWDFSVSLPDQDYFSEIDEKFEIIKTRNILLLEKFHVTTFSFQVDDIILESIPQNSSSWDIQLIGFLPQAFNSNLLQHRLRNVIDYSNLVLWHNQIILDHQTFIDFNKEEIKNYEFSFSHQLALNLSDIKFDYNSSFSMINQQKFINLFGLSNIQDSPNCIYGICSTALITNLVDIFLETEVPVQMYQIDYTYNIIFDHSQYRWLNHKEYVEDIEDIQNSLGYSSQYFPILNVLPQIKDLSLDLMARSLIVIIPIFVVFIFLLDSSIKFFFSKKRKHIDSLIMKGISLKSLFTHMIYGIAGLTLLGILGALFLSSFINIIWIEKDLTTYEFLSYFIFQQKPIRLLGSIYLFFLILIIFRIRKELDLIYDSKITISNQDHVNLITIIESSTFDKVKFPALSIVNSWILFSISFLFLIIASLVPNTQLVEKILILQVVSPISEVLLILSIYGLLLSLFNILIHYIPVIIGFIKSKIYILRKSTNENRIRFLRLQKSDKLQNVFISILFIFGFLSLTMYITAYYHHIENHLEESKMQTGISYDTYNIFNNETDFEEFIEDINKNFTNDQKINAFLALNEKNLRFTRYEDENPDFYYINTEQFVSMEFANFELIHNFNQNQDLFANLVNTNLQKTLLAPYSLYEKGYTLGQKINLKNISTASETNPDENYISFEILGFYQKFPGFVDNAELNAPFILGTPEKINYSENTVRLTFICKDYEYLMKNQENIYSFTSNYKSNTFVNPREIQDVSSNFIVVCIARIFKNMMLSLLFCIIIGFILNTYDFLQYNSLIFQRLYQKGLEFRIIFVNCFKDLNYVYLFGWLLGVLSTFLGILFNRLINMKLELSSNIINELAISPPLSLSILVISLIYGVFSMINALYLYVFMNRFKLKIITK